MASEWNEIGERLQGLGGKLKSHFDETGPNQWPDALNKLGVAVEDLFKTASNAVQDENVRSDVRDVGHLIAGAVSNTLGAAGNDIREWFDAHRGTSPTNGEAGGTSESGGTFEAGGPDKPDEPAA
jgi:hypothetical protein